MQSPLDLRTVQVLRESSTHPSLQASANAWLTAYDLAHQLAFTETVALGQADAAWDRAAEPWRRAAEDVPVDGLVESGDCAIQVRR